MGTKRLIDKDMGKQPYRAHPRVLGGETKGLVGGTTHLLGLRGIEKLVFNSSHKVLSNISCKNYVHSTW